MPKVSIDGRKYKFSNVEPIGEGFSFPCDECGAEEAFYISDVKPVYVSKYSKGADYPTFCRLCAAKWGLAW